MTKKQLAELVASGAWVKNSLAKKILNLTFECMTNALVRGETLEFRDFGVFKVKTRKAKVGRNPKTGITVQVPERKVIVWKMGKELKEKIKR